MASSHHRLAAVLAIVVVLGLKSVAGTKIHFPRSSPGKFPRLRIDGTLPPLRELTFCAWLKPFDSPNNYSTVFSYATAEATHNEFLILLFNSGGEPVLQIYRAGRQQSVKCGDWRAGDWQHLCVSWSGATGAAKSFVNSERCQEVVVVGKEAPIVPSGGVAIIGQEQDAPDSKFDHTQSWYGDMTSIHMWDEVLSERQIRDVWTCGGGRKMKGNVISWDETPMVVFDGVITSKTEHCSA